MLTLTLFTNTVLRFTVKEVAKKEKIRSLQDIQYLLIEECLAASCIFSISMISL